MLPLQPSSLERLSQHLFDQAMKAINHGEREIAASAVGRPFRVTAEAATLHAHALTDQMLAVLAHITAMTSGSPVGSISRQMQGNALSHITSYMGYVVMPRIYRAELPEADRQDAVTFLAEAAGVLADVVKYAAEAGDLALFDEAVDRWRQFGQQWLGDPGDDVPDSLTDRGRQALDRQRLVLGAWLLGRLWSDTANSAALHTFTAINWFDSVQHVFDLADMPYDDPASNRLLRWVLWAQTNSHAGPVDIGIDTTTPILRMLVIMACKLGVPPSLRLRPSQWLHDNARTLETVVVQVEVAHALVAALGITSVTSQTAALRLAIGEAVTEREKILEEELVQASIDDARVQTFAQAVRTAWTQRRIAATLLRQAGAYEEVDGGNPDTRFGYRQYESKSWYIDDRVDMEGYAKQIGYRIADGENRKLLEALAKARLLRRRAGDLNQKFDQALAEMRNRGYQPTAVFVKWRSWEVPRGFDLQRGSEPAGQLGTFRGLPVIQAPSLGDHTIVLADLKAFATFRQWTENGQAIGVTVTGYDEPSALAAVRADRTLMHAPGRRRLAERARELRKLVLVEVWEDCAVTVNDADAARAVSLSSA
jgi:hypothetical protein